MHITSVFIHIYSNKNNHNLDYCWWYELIGRSLLSIIHVAWATCFSLSYYEFEQILNGNVQELSLFDLYSAKLVMNEHKNHGRMYKQVLVWSLTYLYMYSLKTISISGPLNSIEFLCSISPCSFRSCCKKKFKGT